NPSRGSLTTMERIVNNLLSVDVNFGTNDQDRFQTKGQRKPINDLLKPLKIIIRPELKLRTFNSARRKAGL
ncbi:MAG TPA: hypothetical protein VII90_01395, partial [Anaerolineales bacterium]